MTGNAPFIKLNFFFSKPFRLRSLFLVLVLFATIPNSELLTFLVTHLDRFSLHSTCTALFENFLILSRTSLLIAGCFVLGKMCAPSSVSKHFFSSLGLGVGIVSFILFILGSCGLYSENILFTVYIGLAVLSAANVSSIIVFLNNLKKKIWRVYSGAEILIFGFIASIFLQALFVACAPQYAWDTLAHHLALPKLFLLSENIKPVLFIMQNSSWPLLSEIFFGITLTFGEGAEAGVFHLFIGLCTVLLTYQIARRYTSHEGSILACCIFAGLDVFGAVLPMATNDLIIVFYFLLAYYYIIAFRHTRSTKDLVMCGVFTGFALSAKLSGLILWLIPASMIMTHSAHTIKKRLRDCALMGGIAALIYSPWLFRSWLWMDNPVWPFLSSVFGGKYLDRMNQDSFFTSLLIDPSLFECFIKFPLRLYGMFDGFEWQKPLSFFIPFTLVMMIKIKKISAFKWLILPVPIFSFFFFYQTQVWRFTLPLFALLSIAASGLLIMLYRGKTAHAWTACIITLLFLFPLNDVYPKDAFLTFIGFTSSRAGITPRERYKEMHFNAYPMIRWIHDHTPEDAKILLFREVRGFYLDREYLWGHPLTQPFINYDAWGQAGGFSQITELGITHILINRLYKAPFEFDASRILDRELPQKAQLIQQINKVELWRLTPQPPAQ